MVFLKVNFSNIFEELNVEVVTKICLMVTIFSNSLIKGTTLKNSPTLEQWNQTNLPSPLFFLFIENFSKNLEGFSFLLSILYKIIKGEKIL